MGPVELFKKKLCLSDGLLTSLKVKPCLHSQYLNRLRHKFQTRDAGGWRADRSGSHAELGPGRGAPPAPRAAAGARARAGVHTGRGGERHTGPGSITLAKRNSSPKTLGLITSKSNHNPHAHGPSHAHMPQTVPQTSCAWMWPHSGLWATPHSRTTLVHSRHSEAEASQHRPLHSHNSPFRIALIPGLSIFLMGPRLP